MGTQEQNEIRKKYYNEAIRYMNNAKETLKKAGKEDYRYKDAKYVKTACGTAYNGVLIALDGLFLIKNLPKVKNRKSVEYYENNISKMDKKLMNYFSDTYKILHLYGYYDGIADSKVVLRGFELAHIIIETIKPSTAALAGTKKTTTTKRKPTAKQLAALKKGREKLAKTRK